VTTDPSSDASFITAAVTNGATGDTSEFSAPKKVRRV
jgi:hypothetical protein